MWSVLLSAAVLVGSACADDAPVTASDSMGTTTGTDSAPTVTITTFDTGDSTSEVADTTAGETTVSVDSTATVGEGTTTGEDTTAGDDTTTGGEVLPGRSISQLVSAGERASSASYTLVYTFGQPSALQSTHVSTNYQIQGGLIGANGSPP